MFRIHLVLLFFFCSGVLLANPRERFCRQGRMPGAANLKAANVHYRIAFQNSGGVMNAGVCLWHSLLQRSALYLAHFEPDLPKPTENQVIQILNALKLKTKVVVIPGFRDFYSFTLAHMNLIQKFLNYWQIEDGFIFQEWVSNMRSPAWLPAVILRREMEQLYQEVMKEKNVAWVMLKLPGIPAHAWLVYSVERDEKGMDLWVVDSNHPYLYRKERYDYGTNRINTRDFGPAAPYLRRSSDHHFFEFAIQRFCHGVL